ATSALYRPGPLEGGMVMQYVDVKNGRMPIPKVHPIIDEIVEETYGVMVYQEQVMRILNRLGGIELSSAYLCIKAISKKKLKIIAEFKQQFIDGAVEQGMEQLTAEELFLMIEKFAGYGFNKSHSTAYGAIAYQTAFLKAHYPLEFMAALLSCGMESSERIAEHIDDCRRMGIEVLSPDVNSSDVEFGVAGDKLTFGMTAIKGVGAQAVAAIVAEREESGPFKNIYDLTERVDPKSLNRGTLETLIKAGALDGFGPNRPQHIAAAERAVQAAASRFRDRQIGQKNLFGGDDSDDDEAEVDVQLPAAPDWTHGQKLQLEKEVFGFYLTSHPLAECADQISRHATHRMNELSDLEDKDEVFLGGMVGSIKRTQTKKPSRNGHTRYANFDFESPDGIVRCIIWPEQFSRYEEWIKSETICYVSGRIDKRGREPNVIVDRIMSLEDADNEYTQQVAVKFQRGLHSEADMTRVRDILSRFPGRIEVVIVVDSAQEETPSKPMRYLLKTPAALRVSCSSELQTALRDVLGEEHLRFHSPSRRRNGNGNRRPQTATM
ncbi:MAG: DNA polymerase III subunit alpha, partial [Planctomycetaceae bacterium]|nr:DNA polymerase III subunit alpha [Planctomycetaceae bacterium]